MQDFWMELDERCREKLEELLSYLMMDPLLGIPNRHYFEFFLKRELEIGRRYGLPLSVLFVDADNLKEINDTYGHLVGDPYLKAVVEAVRSVLRSSDLIVRWGGDEFLILAHTDLKGALKLRERIRNAVNGRCVVIEGAELGMSVSVGVAEVGGSILEAIREADDMMYREKRIKKDCHESGEDS